MKKSKLFVFSASALALSLLVGVIAVGPANASVFAKKVIFGERSETLQELEKLETEGKGTVIEEGEGWTLKEYKTKDGQEAVMFKSTGESKEEYNYKDPEGRWEIKAGPSVKSELERMESLPGVEKIEGGR